MDNKTYLTNQKFCPVPWTGLMYNFDGSVKNCIRSAKPIGNISNNTIQEILTGSDNTQTQQDMLQGQPGSRCYPCYDLEQNKKSFDIISDRVFYLRELKSVPLATYNQPGHHDLYTIDVRWSNLCNFACVYCSADFSSKWASELQIHKATPSDEQLQNFKEYIFQHAAQLKHVYLAGGEPLLMKENSELLDLLRQVNPGVNLRINTNLSKVDTRIFDQICEFQNVHWTVSVESIEQEFEYIRYGGVWQNFLENLTTIKQLNHKISFNMLHFILNYQSVFGCVDYLKGLGFHNNSFIIGALLRPEWMNIRHLPDAVLNQIKVELVRRIDEKPGFLLEDSYRNMLSYLDKPLTKNLSQSFEFLAEMDRRRNLDSSKIFTDLYKLR